MLFNSYPYTYCFLRSRQTGFVINLLLCLMPDECRTRHYFRMPAFGGGAAAQGGARAGLDRKQNQTKNKTFKHILLPSMTLKKSLNNTNCRQNNSTFQCLLTVKLQCGTSMQVGTYGLQTCRYFEMNLFTSTLVLCEHYL